MAGTPAQHRFGRPRAATRRAFAAVAVAYASWLGMMAVHEFGHVLHALASGGRVVSVSVPLLGFSQTLVYPNPREGLVTWGGPAWGVLIPTIAWVATRTARGRVPAALTFFTGFCLITNGAYVGAGWLVGGAGNDAAELLRLGTPRWVMVFYGIACVAAGLWCWHQIPAMSFKPAAPAAPSH